MHIHRSSARWCAALLVTSSVVTAPSLLVAQDRSRPSARDSVRADSVARLKAVSIVAAPAERAQPVSATHVDAASIRLTPANSPYDLLRQTAGVEVHPGPRPRVRLRRIAARVQLRPFHRLALWVDGVPINEPMNGHAEGYNDWPCSFPAAFRTSTYPRANERAVRQLRAGRHRERADARADARNRRHGVGGSFGRAEAMVMTGFDHGSEGGGVLGARFQREDGIRPNARYDVGQGHARIVRDLRPGVTLDAGAELYGGNWNSPGLLSEDEFAAHEYNIVSNPTDGGYKRRAQERVSLRVLSGNMLWRTTAYATQGRWQLFLTIPPAGGRFEGSGSQTEEEDSRAGLGVTSALTWALPNGEITIGGETRWDRRTTRIVSRRRAREIRSPRWSRRGRSRRSFLQSYIDLTDRVRVDLGARDECSERAPRRTRIGVECDAGRRLAQDRRAPPRLAVGRRVRECVARVSVDRRDHQRPDARADHRWAYEGGAKFDRNGCGCDGGAVPHGREQRANVQSGHTRIVERRSQPAPGIGARLACARDRQRGHVVWQLDVQRCALSKPVAGSEDGGALWS